MQLRREDLLAYYVYGCLMLYPMTTFIFEGFRSVFLALLLLAYFYMFFLKDESKVNCFNDVDVKVLLIGLLSLPLVAFISSAYFEFSDKSLVMLTVYAYFLFIPLFFSLFIRIKPNLKVIWLSILIASFIVCARALLEEFNLVVDIKHPTRASGTMHPIRFGDLSLILGLITFAGSLYLQQLTKWERLLGVAGFIAGVVASLLSGSRGGWIAMPLMLVIIAIPVFRQASKKYKGLIVVCLVIFFALFSSNDYVQKRYAQATSDVNKYLQGDSLSSLGIRFDMFEMAVGFSQKNLVMGIGIGHYFEHVKQLQKQDDKLFNYAVWTYTNPHNEFLLHLATRGVVGLISLISMFIIGIWYFYRQYSQDNAEIKFAAVSGLLLLLGYLQFGMSIALFEHRDFTIFFIIYISLFASAVKYTGNNKETTQQTNILS